MLRNKSTFNAASGPGQQQQSIKKQAQKEQDGKERKKEIGSVLKTHQ